MKEAKYYRCVADGALNLKAGRVYPAGHLIQVDNDAVALEWFMVYGFHKTDFEEAQEWEYAVQCDKESTEKMADFIGYREVQSLDYEPRMYNGKKVDEVNWSFLLTWVGIFATCIAIWVLTFKLIF